MFDTIDRGVNTPLLFLLWRSYGRHNEIPWVEIWL